MEPALGTTIQATDFFKLSLLVFGELQELSFEFELPVIHTDAVLLVEEVVLLSLRSQSLNLTLGLKQRFPDSLEVPLQLIILLFKHRSTLLLGTCLFLVG